MFYRRILPSVVSLRRRHLAFLFAAATVSPSGTMAKERGESLGSNGLLLYYDQFSFFSQKVVMVLHEKKLPFEVRQIDLIKSEQYESWFLELNPRGEVPVLQDTGKIIPDSARIIDYLEDNFSNGNTPRLIPLDLGADVRQKISTFRRLLQQAPQASLTTGAVLNQQYMKNPKVPFIGPIRNALASAEKNAGKALREYAEKNPHAKELLLAKAAAREQKCQELSDEKNFIVVLEETDKILNQVEAELALHTDENLWLCSDRFTIADVELTVLLIRINQLGLEERFWTNGKRPNIEKYFEKAKQRDSYKHTVPTTFDLVTTIVKSQTSVLLVGAAAAVATIFGVKRYF